MTDAERRAETDARQPQRYRVEQIDEYLWTVWLETPELLRQVANCAWQTDAERICRLLNDDALSRRGGARRNGEC